MVRSLCNNFLAPKSIFLMNIPLDYIKNFKLEFFSFQAKMDDQTAFVLALQLIALCTVVSALILYLMCKIRRNYLSGFADDGNLTYLNIGGGKKKFNEKTCLYDTAFKYENFLLFYSFIFFLL